MARQILNPRPRVIVGVDFGTMFTGFAYTFSSDPGETHKCYEWPQSKEAGAKKSLCKTQTSLLYVDGDILGSYELKEWGHAAQVQHDRDVDNLSKGISKNESKLGLHSGSGLDSSESSDDSLHCPRIQGKSYFLTRLTGTSATDLPTGLTRRRVISDYLRKLSQFIMRVLQYKALDDILMEEVQWCFTVPAVSGSRKRPGKQEMTICAKMAGLVSGPGCPSANGSLHPLITVLESEAASVNCQRRLESPLDSGDKFLLVDLGGETVDLVLLEKLDPQSAVKATELSSRSSALCFESWLEQAFFKFLTRKIHSLEDSVQEHDILLLKRWWANIVSDFDSSNQFGDVGYDLELPIQLAQKLQEDETPKFQTDLEGDAIEISLQDMFSILDPVVDQILPVIEANLVPDVKAMMIIFGDFFFSPYIVKRIRGKFSAKVGIIMAPKDSSGVKCSGAVAYALHERGILPKVNDPDEEKRLAVHERTPVKRRGWRISVPRSVHLRPKREEDPLL